ncbi:MAG: hypothetical protein SFU25_12075 [Candidatus Caenarcaniphilales bacterium]|nr:hypothetical protein [Candidatus Caenarcaniphilales bacterium]
MTKHKRIIKEKNARISELEKELNKSNEDLAYLRQCLVSDYKLNLDLVKNSRYTPPIDLLDRCVQRMTRLSPFYF